MFYYFSLLYITGICNVQHMLI